MAGARPSSLLLRNRTSRIAAAESQGLELFSRSGRRPLPSALDDASRAPRAGESQIETMLVGSSERAQSRTVEPLSGASSDSEKQEWLLSPPGTNEESTLGAQNASPGKDSSSAVPLTASTSSQHHMPYCESGGQATRSTRSSSALDSSMASISSGNISNNPNKAYSQSTGPASGTSRRSSTPNKLPTPARPSTPNRLPTPSRPSTPNRPSSKPSTTARPSTPNKPSTAARPSTPNKPSAADRPSTPNKPSAAARPTPNKPSPAARPSTPSRPSAVARPSTPSKPSEADRPSTPSRPSANARPSTPNRFSAPTRPSTPSAPNRPSAPARPSTPNRQAASASAKAAAQTRPSTPNKRGSSAPTHAASTNPPATSSPSNPSNPRSLSSSGEKSRTSSTAVHPQTPASSNLGTSRATSQTSTPTRRTPVSAPVASRSNSAGRFPASRAKNSGPVSRPSSPDPKMRTSTQPIIPLDFPLDVPSNLRTKLPDRPASAGRTRPGAKLTGRANLESEPPLPANPTRRQSPSKVTSRGYARDSSPKTRTPSGGYGTPLAEFQKTERDDPTNKTSKTHTSLENSGPGRTLTKKSLEMALKRMDIRQGAGGIRGMSLFPHSIRTSSTKGSSGRSSGILTPTSSNETDTEDNSWNGTTSGSASINDGVSENGDIFTSFPHGAVLVARVTEPDLYEGYRYDTMLLKEETTDMNWLRDDDTSPDLLNGDNTKDTEWLHSADNTIQSPVFEQQYELLPEPFDLT